MKTIFCLIILATLSSLSFAQDFPRSEFFAGYSYLRTDGEDVDLMDFGNPGVIARRNSANLNGFNIGITGNFTSRIGIVGDVGGFFGKTKFDAIQGQVIVRTRVNTQMYTVLVGPQVYLANGGVKPYVRAMVGFARLSQSIDAPGGDISDDSNSFAAGFGGGLDYKFSDKVSARLFQADFILTRFDGGGVASDTQKAVKISTGFVFRN